MSAWLSVLVPLLVMFFALGMERVESRLRETTLRPEELEELLERPRPDEVRALFRQGSGRRALVGTPGQQGRLTVQARPQTAPALTSPCPYGRNRPDRSAERPRTPRLARQ